MDIWQWQISTYQFFSQQVFSIEKNKYHRSQAWFSIYGFIKINVKTGLAPVI